MEIIKKGDAVTGLSGVAPGNCDTLPFWATVASLNLLTEKYKDSRSIRNSETPTERASEYNGDILGGVTNWE